MTLNDYVKLTQRIARKVAKGEDLDLLIDSELDQENGEVALQIVSAAWATSAALGVEDMEALEEGTSLNDIMCACARAMLQASVEELLEVAA